MIKLGLGMLSNSVRNSDDIEDDMQVTDCAWHNRAMLQKVTKSTESQHVFRPTDKKLKLRKRKVPAPHRVGGARGHLITERMSRLGEKT